MKLGVVGLLPSWEQIDLDAAQRVRAAGYRGVSIFFQRPLAADLAAVKKLKSILEAAGLEVAQANGWYEVLVHPDDQLRAEGVAGLQALTHIGRWLDAKTVYVRPGSLNPRGAWYPHPENYAPRTFERLVASLRQAAQAAQAEAMLLALEGHVLSLLDTPQRLRDVIDAVGSPALQFNTDPVNFIGTVKDAYDPSRVLDELVTRLGQHTVAAHLKDMAVQDKLVLHIDEVVIGEGTMDYGRLLRQMEQINPDMYGIIEHLPDEKIPQARAGLMRAAEKAGIQLIT
jgi:sugar phosphate isomerase/epimerase